MRRMKPVARSIFALLALLPAAAWADQPLITDNTDTKDAGENQLEATYSRTVDKAPGSRVVTHEVPVVFTRGITDSLELAFEGTRQRVVPGAPASAEEGWTNTVISAKWRFYENEASKISVAIKPEIRIPVSKSREARGLGTARVSYGIGLLMTRETGFGAVHANLVADRVNYDDTALNAAERRTKYRLSVAPVWEVTDQWALALDAGLMTHPDRTARTLMGYVEVGTIYSPTKDLELALGVIRSIMDRSADSTQVTMGATWRFR